MNNHAPSRDEWAALYQAAVAFRDIGAWEWMYDSDLFGVQNPETGEIGYCCIMGNLGEHFALGVYLGSEGLAGYLTIASGALDPPSIAVLHYQTCLMASYEDRDHLERQDRDVIKALGLKFRGRHAWPLFRSYRPDHLPWFITADEARFLTIALQQAVDVALRFRDDESLLDPRDDGAFFVRVPEQRAEGLHWSDQWLTPAPLAASTHEVPQVDELRIQRIKQAQPTRQGVWEADFFLSPTPIQEHKGARPYYPYMLFWVEQRSGMVLPPHLVPPGQHRAEFQSYLLTLIEQTQVAPEEVQVLYPDPAALLEPVTDALGIRLRQVRKLPALEEARESLMSYLERF